MDCEKTIWVGKFKDKKGTFEILVPACNRNEAYNKIFSSIKEIKEERKIFLTKIEDTKIEDEDLMYIEDVGDFDYIRI